ncbi:hypothetical protein IB238_18525 [Rhizobium sp. ARZ01]|uniref:hypothetical protein n=1 Tax=Rhizobium sp. ARZ01 TaxID=2769313 RepID=UPI001786056D|nr:hypothetical protein [Rhizobium sp. ARZ01]MBD9374623.1 hypothetical protein [Rhizobium sp. ARZ01]
MSIDGSHDGEVSGEAIALLLEGGAGEVLTDLLVSALKDAYRFLAEDMPVDTRH